MGPFVAGGARLAARDHHSFFCKGRALLDTSVGAMSNQRCVGETRPLQSSLAAARQKAHDMEHSCNHSPGLSISVTRRSSSCWILRTPSPTPASRDSSTAISSTNSPKKLSPMGTRSNLGEGRAHRGRRGGRSYLGKSPRVVVRGGRRGGRARTRRPSTSVTRRPSTSVTPASGGEPLHRLPLPAVPTGFPKKRGSKPQFFQTPQRSNDDAVEGRPSPPGSPRRTCAATPAEKVGPGVLAQIWKKVLPT